MLRTLLAWGAAAMVVEVHPARAQQAPAPTRATLVGRVTDPAGTPIDHATVSIPSLERSTTTNADGQYRLSDLPVRTVVIQFRAIGRQAQQRTVVLTAGASMRIDIALEASAIEVAPIVVTGTPTESNALTPLDIDVVDPEQFTATSTASLGKSLELVPGVSNLSTGPVAGNPVLRGLSQSHIKIVRDGVPQENFQATARWFPPGNMADVQRVEVVRGPASVLYGPNAVGGAVNLIPRPLPRTEDGGTMIGGLAGVQYFSNNNERYAQGEVNAAFSNGIGVRAGGSRRVADDFTVPSVPTFSSDSQPGAPLYSGTVPFTNFDQTEGYGQLGVARGWGQVYANFDWWQGANNFLNANGTPTAVQMKNIDARVRGNLFAGAFVITPIVLYQQAGILRNTQAKTYEEAQADDEWNQDLVNDVYTGRVAVQHPSLAGLRGTFGLEYNRQDVTVTKSTIEPSSVLKNFAVFAFEEYQFRLVSISGGLRFDGRRLAANPNALVSGLPPDEQETALNRTFNAVTGSLGAGWQVSRAFTIAVNASTGFRPPTSLDLYSDEFRPVLGSYVEGNPLLEPERSYSFEGSLRAQSRRFAGSLIAYYNLMNNYMYLEKTDRTRPRQGNQVPVYVNTQADGRIWGVELTASGEVVSRLLLDGNYTRIRSENAATGEQLPLMPADYLRLGVRYAAPRWGFLGAPYAEVNGKHAWAKSAAGPTEPFAEPDRNPDGPGVGSTTAYTLFGVGIGGRFSFGGSSLDVYLAVENLFNTAYRDFLDTMKGITLGQGRNLTIRLSAPLVFSR